MQSINKSIYQLTDQKHAFKKCLFSNCKTDTYYIVETIVKYVRVEKFTIVNMLYK